MEPTGCFSRGNNVMTELREQEEFANERRGLLTATADN